MSSVQSKHCIIQTLTKTGDCVGDFEDNKQIEDAKLRHKNLRYSTHNISIESIITIIMGYRNYQVSLLIAAVVHQVAGFAPLPSRPIAALSNVRVQV